MKTELLQEAALQALGCPTVEEVRSCALDGEPLPLRVGEEAVVVAKRHGCFFAVGPVSFEALFVALPRLDPADLIYQPHMGTLGSWT